jgi:serine/threonine protein kinase
MPPSLIADRYHVLRELGRGGMGVVYQVLRKDTGEQHALKVLLGHKTQKGDSVERFRRELKLPARIGSEHVVQVSDSGEVTEEDGAPFYVMELLRGCDLRKLLDIQHPFTPPQILWILRQIAAGLGKAHEIGIVHRDLKPDNIFLHCRDDGRLVVKILDFGIARFAQDLLDTGDKEKLTATQAMLGTPLYMAPEQAKGGEGRAEIGPCTDIWAMGMIVFELLNGQPYWNSDSLVAHIGQLLFAPMAPASGRGAGLPAGFDPWFARSCNRDSSQRYPSVGQQIADLARLLGLGAVDGEPPPALLAAVKKHIPPLVDHRSPTMAPGSAEPRGPEDAETRILAGSKLLQGSSEQNLRAEIFPGQSGARQGGGGRLGQPKVRVLLSGAVLLCLGAVVLIVVGNKPGTAPTKATLAADMATGATDLAARPDPTTSPAPTAVVQPGSPPGIAQPPPESRRHKASKPSKAAETRESQKKPRRTYVPPSL